jgi:hypothetical protein
MEILNIDKLLIPLISILGIIVGALLNFFFTKLKDGHQKKIEQKSKSYTDMVKAITEITIAQKMGDDEMERIATALLIDAKIRVCIYGNQTVLEKTSIFFRYGAVLDNKESCLRFLDMITEMRKNSRTDKESINTSDISMLLLGKDISDL